MLVWNQQIGYGGVNAVFRNSRDKCENRGQRNIISPLLKNIDLPVLRWI